MQIQSLFIWTPTMSSVLRVAYMLTWDPKEVAGGTLLYENRTLYFHGAGVSIIPDIAESLNLTIKAYFGDIYEAFDLVTNGTAEMGGTIMSQDLSWARGLTYLHPLDSETSNVYFRQPPADSIKYIIRPFSGELWAALLLLMLVVSLISRKRSKISMWDFVYRVLIQAVEFLIGRHDVHLRFGNVFTSLAVTKLIISFFSFIISSVFVAKIASILVVQEDLVKKPNDLITYGYKLNTYSNIHVNRVFENHNVTAETINVANDLKYITNVMGKPNEDTRQTVFSHADGFYPAALYSLGFDKELCTISVLKSTRRTARSFYIRKDSMLRESLNLRIIQLIERGINHRHQVQFQSKFKYNCLQQVTQFNQLTFKFVQLGFVPLCAGFAVAFVVQLVEGFTLWTKTFKANMSKSAGNFIKIFNFLP